MKESQDIVKSNALVEAVYSPSSVYQMRLFLAALLQVKAKKNLNHEGVYRVTAQQLAELTGIKSGDNYRELEKAAKQLRTAGVRLRHDFDGKLIPNGDWLEVNLVSSCRYRAKQGCVDIRFTPEITPYISSLRKRFTQYKAQHVMPMRSGYGVRLYELCLQWMGKEREFTVEEFRKILNLSAPSYERIEVLKRKVINPALKDINTHSDIQVEFSQRKAGRRVTHFVFSITKPKPKPVKQAKRTIKPKPLTHRAWIEKFKKARAGESWEQALSRTQKEYYEYCGQAKLPV